MTTPDTLPQRLKAPVRDGMAWGCMMGFGENYISACGIFLRATATQIALLATIPAFVGSLFQLASVWSLRLFSSRKTPIRWSVRAVSLAWLCLGLLVAVAEPGNLAVWLFISLVCFYRAGENFLGPPWASLIGDLVPAESRGRFFGKRNRSIGLCTFLAVLGGGFLLDLCDRAYATGLGFCLIFLLACGSRVISGYWLSRYEDRPMAPRHDGYFSLWQFLRRSPRSNFARFVYFISWINCAVAISGPFFALYMLRDLGLSYVEFTLVSAATTVTQFLTLATWGRVSDQLGNKRILNVCGIGVGIVPLLWVFEWNLWFLFLIQVFGGFMWAGFNLAAANFVFDAVTPAKRARCAAYQSFVNAFFVLAGSLLGAYIVERLPPSYHLWGWEWVPHSPLFGIFIISGVVRLTAAFIILPLFSEVRSVPQVGRRDLLFRITGFRPFGGSTFTVVSESPRKSRPAPK